MPPSRPPPVLCHSKISPRTSPRRRAARGMALSRPRANKANKEAVRLGKARVGKVGKVDKVDSKAPRDKALRDKAPAASRARMGSKRKAIRAQPVAEMVKGSG